MEGKNQNFDFHVLVLLFSIFLFEWSTSGMGTRNHFQAQGCWSSKSGCDVMILILWKFAYMYTYIRRSYMQRKQSG